MILYYIAGRKQFPGTDAAQRSRLLEKIGEAARAGVDYIQLREKDLPTRELEQLARAALRVVREHSPGKTRLVINSRTDVAIACGADGVHLRSDDYAAAEARKIFSGAGMPQAVIGVSCHSPEELRQATGADFVVFAPVFDKPGARLQGLQGLKEACRSAGDIPVLALGGVTLENAAACLEAGAAGIAAIRLFQKGDVAAVVKQLRAL